MTFSLLEMSSDSPPRLTLQHLYLAKVQRDCLKCEINTHLTFPLFLLGKPEIVSHEGPVDGQVRCVAEGFPAPQITWYYCEQPYIR